MTMTRRKRYILVGGSVYLLELLTIEIAQKWGAGPTLAVAVSFWLGLMVSFGLQKFVTFKDRRLHHKVLLPQLLAYVGLVLFNFGFTILITRLLASQITAIWSRTLALAITTLWNYYLYKTKLFAHSDQPAV